MKEKFYKHPAFWIFVAAFIFRIVGVRWGLPNEMRNFSLHPDEQVNLIYARNIVPTQLHFLPGAYNYGTLYLTLLRIVSDVVIQYGGGLDQSGQIPPALLAQVHLAGRLLNCLFGAGLAALTFCLARRNLGQVSSIVAGAIVGVAPALLVHSRFQTVDMLATLLAIASVYACVRLVEPEAAIVKWSVWAGVFAGLSAGTKYIGIVAVFALLVAAFAIKKPKAFFIGIVGALAAFVISTPGCIFDQQAFVRDFMFELNHSKMGHDVVFAETSPALLFHIGNLSSGASILTVLVGAIGLGMAVKGKQLWAILLVAFFVAYYLGVSGGQIKFMRYILPLIPILAVGVGVVVEKLYSAEKPKLGLALGLLVVGGVDFGNLVQGGSFTYLMVTPDPRDEAGKFLASKGPTTVGLVDDPWFWSPTVNPNVDVTRMIGPGQLILLWQSWENPRVVRHLPADPRERIRWDPLLLTEDKPEYVSFTSFEYVPFMRMSQAKPTTDPEKSDAARYDDFMTKLNADYTKVFDNDQYHTPMVEDMEYVRPHVLVWQRKQTASAKP